MYISLQVNRENMKLYPMVPMERLAAQARIKISSTGKTLRNRNRQSLIFNRQSINGFTMVEMLVVLFLIGLMLSIAVPSFIHTVETLKFKATARKIVSTLRYARNTAVFKQMSQAVGFDIDNNLYYLEGQKTDEGFIIEVDIFTGLTHVTFYKE